MADYPTSIFIRPPVIDGRLVRGGGLNAAVTLLDQIRQEIAAIETELGTDPAGSLSTLAARLDVRMAPSGIGRGRVYPLRAPNATASTYEEVAGWYEVGSQNVQFGLTGILTGNDEETITYAQAYSVAPTFIIAKFIPRGTRLGQCQVSHGTIGTTTFKVAAQQFDASGSWTTPSTNWSCLYAAFGGS